MMAESANLIALVLNHRFILVFFGAHRKCQRCGTVWRFGLRSHPQTDTTDLTFLHFERLDLLPTIPCNVHVAVSLWRWCGLWVSVSVYEKMGENGTTNDLGKQHQDQTNLLSMNLQGEHPMINRWKQNIRIDSKLMAGLFSVNLFCSHSCFSWDRTKSSTAIRGVGMSRCPISICIYNMYLCM